VLVGLIEVVEGREDLQVEDKSVVPGNSVMIPYTMHVSSGVFEIKILPQSQLTRQPPLVD
jgi:hypothetical protein